MPIHRLKNRSVLVFSVEDDVREGKLHTAFVREKDDNPEEFLSVFHLEARIRP